MPQSDSSRGTRDRAALQGACLDLARQVIAQVSASGERPLALRVPEFAGAGLDALCRTFGLSPFERAALLLAITMELRTAELLGPCAVELNFGEDVARAFLSPYTLMQWLPDADAQAFQPERPLRAWGLVELGPSGFEHGTDALRALRVSPGALGFALGERDVSGEGRAFLNDVGSGVGLGASQDAAVQDVMAVLGASAAGEWPVLNLCADRSDTTLDVCRALPVRPVLQLGVERVVRAVQQERVTPEGALSVIARDVTLLGATLVIPLDSVIPVPEEDRAGGTRFGTLGWSEVTFVQELCARVRTPVIVLSRDPVTFSVPQDVHALHVHAPTADEQVRFWLDALGLSGSHGHDPVVREHLRQVTTQFTFGASRIAQVARDARRHIHQRYGASPSLTVDALLQEVWEACRRQGRKAFMGIADRMHSRASWEQLVLPAGDLEALQEIVAQVRHRHDVYDAWGCGPGERGLGITVLFSGASGGGKTFAAEVLANTLNLDLYRIDLSSVTSKWIGETEKNLRRIFDAADEGGAILLFDEADSIFGKRGAVQSSNDRYANLTTNYLLQRMEAYRGLAILTTNYEGNIDSAFMRRIRFQVRFHEPDEQLRKLLWQRAFPQGVRTDALDHAALARTKLTGANIKAIALNAAFMAAAREEVVTTALVQEAIRREVRRQGRVILSDALS